jgi:hypothetical protein
MEVHHGGREADDAAGKPLAFGVNRLPSRHSMLMTELPAIGNGRTMRPGVVKGPYTSTRFENVAM